MRRLNRLTVTMQICIALCVLAVGTAPAQNQALSVQTSGTDGFLEVAAASALVPAALTVEAWITYDDANLPTGWVYPTIARKNFMQAQEEWMLRVDAHNSMSRTLNWSVRTAGGVVGATWSFQPGELLAWTHVAGTYDGSMLRLYINGAEVASNSTTGVIIDGGGILKIGAGNTAPGAAYEIWNGKIDEVRVWSLARSEAEIAAQMFQPINMAPSLEASWHLEGNGTDSTGNAHYATMIGTPSYVTAALPQPLYETNDAAASLDIDGVIGTAFEPAVVTRMVGTSSMLNIGSTLVGNGFDLAITIPGPLVPAAGGAIPLASGQLVNINVFSPTLMFVFGGFMPFPGNLSLPIASGAPVGVAAQMVIIDPTHVDGISLSAPFDWNVVSCPVATNFDSLATGVGNYPLGWSNGGGSNEWQVHSGTTVSTGTGPSVGAFSPPNYMYCETSGTGGTGTFVMDTCAMDVSLLSSFTVNFQLSRIGATIGTLNVMQDDGTGTFPILLATYTGAEPSGADWTPESLPFVPAGGLYAAFRFEYTAGGSFTGDIAIDDFSVQ